MAPYPHVATIDQTPPEMASVIAKLRPTAHLPLHDWHVNWWEIQQDSRARRNDSFLERHRTRKARDETDIESNWSAYRTKTSLSEREAEVRRAKETLEGFADRISAEERLLLDEKAAVERHLDSLNLPFAVVDECLRLRDSRPTTELTHDYVDLELRKELDLLEEARKTLSSYSCEAWQKLYDLRAMRLRLNHDVGNKRDALKVDREQLDLEEHARQTTHKYEFPCLQTNAVAFDNWTENNDHLRLLTENEMASSMRLRDLMLAARDKARNDVRTQRDKLDYFLRKRIHDTQSARNELRWQILNMNQEIDKMLLEISNGEECLEAKRNALRLAETRLENRYKRPALEKVRDEPDDKLKNEIIDIRHMIRSLTDQLDSAKSACYFLECQRRKTEDDCDKKDRSMMIDLQILDARIQLRNEQEPVESPQTERNLTLMRIEDEISPP